MRLDVKKVEIKMAEKKMSTKDLAEKYGVGDSRISNILRNKNTTPICAGRLAEALGVHVTEILMDE